MTGAESFAVGGTRGLNVRLFKRFYSLCSYLIVIFNGAWQRPSSYVNYPSANGAPLCLLQRAPQTGSVALLVRAGLQIMYASPSFKYAVPQLNIRL